MCGKGCRDRSDLCGRLQRGRHRRGAGGPGPPQGAGVGSGEGHGPQHQSQHFRALAGRASRTEAGHRHPVRAPGTAHLAGSDARDRHPILGHHRQRGRSRVRRLRRQVRRGAGHWRHRRLRRRIPERSHPDAGRRSGHPGRGADRGHQSGQDRRGPPDGPGPHRAPDRVGRRARRRLRAVRDHPGGRPRRDHRDLRDVLPHHPPAAGVGRRCLHLRPVGGHGVAHGRPVQRRRPVGAPPRATHHRRAAPVHPVVLACRQSRGLGRNDHRPPRRPGRAGPFGRGRQHRHSPRADHRCVPGDERRLGARSHRAAQAGPQAGDRHLELAPPGRSRLCRSL